MIATEAELLATAMALGAGDVPGWSRAERRLVASLPAPDRRAVADAGERIREAGDPLGEAFTRLRAPAVRRRAGATYTPPAIVGAMLAGLARRPARVVDPGAGSGRFLLAAARRFPDAELVGVELDPVASILARASLAGAGLARRATLLHADYRAVALPRRGGPTLFVGNPPYVRHHGIEPRWKQWLAEGAAALGLEASRLAGLHAYFFLATASIGRAGDFGAFVTAAEWLDVNYGSLLRELFLGPLGGLGLVVIEPTALPFPDATTTAAITWFRLGARPRSVFLDRVADLDALARRRRQRRIPRQRLRAERRWSALTLPPRQAPEGWVDLGELCRVHRGQATGANGVWIESGSTCELPASVLFATVTRARELIAAAPVLDDPRPLRRVVDLPEDLEALAEPDRRAVERFLSRARRLGAHRGYLARHRRAWWCVGLRSPAPILATYMARRPPAFVRNLAGARHLNIAHGIYPREPLPEASLRALVTHLSRATTVAQGRTYAGGLTKFEPREMERLPVPGPAILAAS